MTRILFAATALALMAGCASMTAPRHECPLGEQGQKCASVEEVYKATRTGGHVDADGNARTSVLGRAQPEARAQAPYLGAASVDVPAPGQVGAPVFQQPRVMRVWVAPYVDADGNLRSGEYTYFSTPGQWSYGATRRAGAASGAFGPARTDALGFTPSIERSSQPAGRPPAPSPAGASVDAQTPSQLSNITQPYQRLTN